MKKLSIFLCAIMLILATVLPVSAGSMDSVWQGLALEEYAMFVTGDLDAVHMRGFDVTSDGKYILGGCLNPKGQSTLEKIDVEKQLSVGKYQHIEADGKVSYIKGVDIDDRGYVYGGVANNANNGAVYFAIIKLEDMQQVCSVKIDIAGKCGVNGTAVAKIGDRYYLYFVVNYDTDRIYCYDVTDVNNPVLNTSFGDNKGYLDLTKMDITEGNYLAVDGQGVIYLAAAKKDNKQYLMQLTADGLNVIKEVEIASVYGVSLYNDYIIATTNKAVSTVVYVIDKATLSIVATIKDKDNDAISYYPMAVVAGNRIYTVEANYASMGDRVMRTQEINFASVETTTAAPETTTAVPGTTTAAPITTTAAPANTTAPTSTPSTGSMSMVYLAAAVLAVVTVAVVSRRRVK